MAFIGKAYHGSFFRTAHQGEKRATAVRLVNLVKYPKRPLLPILTPTAPTRALNSQAKRHVWLRHNGAVALAPNVSRLKRSAPKR